MDVSGQETDWRSAAFRQKLVSQIEDAMRKAGVGHSISSKDMENHVFLKAKTRDEYLSLVARLIIHFRDICVFGVLGLSRGAPASWNPWKPSNRTSG
ncbi:mediator of RNA polymerase II transcription subunit 15-like isoform X1 [Marmota flaviventris]|uniref:mediator of RNA polymerase II transcription subunit 15-like isoform X1 n=1 Tax=Marmota flaviventris TaxID=93162 RepID=UPI003A840350